MEEKVEDLGDLARGALLGGGVLPGEAGAGAGGGEVPATGA